MKVTDEELWKIAKKRAAFQQQLKLYVVVNILLWVIWYLTAYRNNVATNLLPWPVWPMVGWGIGLLFTYLDAYGNSKETTTQREFERLKQKQEQNQ
jgi:hypothetical protein